MTERPILFSAPMVRAMLAGTKTQTRRIVKPQPTHVASFAASAGASPIHPAVERLCPTLRCPHGAPGDRLWVREAWADTNGESGPMISYKAGDDRFLVEDSYPCGDLRRGESGHAWRSPLYMPRWASRITLAVEAVRVERLHDVTRDDAMAEGIPQMHGEACSIGLIEPRGGGPRNGPNSRDIWDNSTSVENYARLWDSINGKRAPWASNPWVWVVTFSRMENVRWLERGIDQIEGRLLWEAENNTAKERE